MGASWFFDPQLEFISPELDFVRATALRWGAVTAHVEREDSPGSGALSLSSHRRELYEKGEYVPEVHTFFLSRNDSLKHADSIQAPVP